MLAVLHPIIAHELQHLEKLLKVQVLLVGHNVQRLYEVIGILSVYGCRKIPGGVKGCAVGAEYDAGGHIVCRQIHKGRPLVHCEQSLFPQLVYDCTHLVLIEAFACVAVARFTIAPIMAMSGLVPQRS